MFKSRWGQFEADDWRLIHFPGTWFEQWIPKPPHSYSLLFTLPSLLKPISLHQLHSTILLSIAKTYETNQWMVIITFTIHPFIRIFIHWFFQSIHPYFHPLILSIHPSVLSSTDSFSPSIRTFIHWFFQSIPGKQSKVPSFSRIIFLLWSFHPENAVVEVTKSPRKSQVVTGCYKLSQVVISCHRLLWVVTSCYELSQVVISCHRMLTVVTGCYELSQVVISCHRLL